MEPEGNSSSAASAAEERASNTRSSSSSGGGNAGGDEHAAAVNGASPTSNNGAAEPQKTESEMLKEKASEGLRILLQQKPPSTPDAALLQQHREKHAECTQLLEHMQHLLEKRLYHEFTLAAMAYLAPLALLETSSSAVGAGDRGNAGPLAAAASLSFLPFPSGYPTFAPFERVTLFHRVIAPLRPKLDLSAFLRLLAAVCEDLEPVDALVFLDAHRLVQVSGGDGKQQQSRTSSGSSSSSSSSSGGSSSSSSSSRNVGGSSTTTNQRAGGGGGASTEGNATRGGGNGGGSSSSIGGSATSLAGAAAALEAELLFRSCESYHFSRYDRLTESEEILEDLKRKLTVTMGVSPIAQAAFHRAAATLAKAQDKYADFYHQAMMFLAYTPAASIPENERVGLAYEVAIAALVAPDIFNFGELLQQALVISSLQLPEHRWLYDLVDAFHCGSMAKYDETCSRFGHQIESTALAAHMPALRRKISISALLRLAFTHSAAGAATAATAEGSGTNAVGDMDTNRAGGSELKPMAARSLSFQAVASTCKVALDEVELLVMSAMSKQLLRGSIDQVNREVNISWVRPALLLDDTGMACLQDRLLRWVASAQQLHQHLQGQTAELLGS